MSLNKKLQETDIIQINIISSISSINSIFTSFSFNDFFNDSFSSKFLRAFGLK